jgi:hypothetical protein
VQALVHKQVGRQDSQLGHRIPRSRVERKNEPGAASILAFLERLTVNRGIDPAADGCNPASHPFREERESSEHGCRVENSLLRHFAKEKMFLIFWKETVLK